MRWLVQVLTVLVVLACVSSKIYRCNSRGKCSGGDQCCNRVSYFSRCCPAASSCCSKGPSVGCCGPMDSCCKRNGYRGVACCGRNYRCCAAGRYRRLRMTCCYKIPVWLWIFLGLSLVLILLMLLLTVIECVMEERSNTDYGVDGRGGAVPPPNTDYGTYNRPSRPYDEPRFQTPPPRYPTPPPDYDASLNDPSSNRPANNNNNGPRPNNNTINNNNANVNNNNANVNNNNANVNNNNSNPTDISNGIIVFNNNNNNDNNDNVTETTNDNQLNNTELERQILASSSADNEAGYDGDVDAADISLDSIRSTEVEVVEDDMEPCSSTHNLNQSLDEESKMTRNNSWETFLRKTFDRNSLKKKLADFSPSLAIDESLPSATDLTFTDSGMQDGYESDVSTATSSFHCSSWDEDEEVDIRGGKEVVYELNNVTSSNSRVPRLQNLVETLAKEDAKE